MDPAEREPKDATGEQAEWVAPRLRKLKTRVIAQSQAGGRYAADPGPAGDLVVLGYVVMDESESG